MCADFFFRRTSSRRLLRRPALGDGLRFAACLALPGASPSCASWPGRPAGGRRGRRSAPRRSRPWPRVLAAPAAVSAALPAIDLAPSMPVLATSVIASCVVVMMPLFLAIRSALWMPMNSQSARVSAPETIPKVPFGSRTAGRYSTLRPSFLIDAPHLPSSRAMLAAYSSGVLGARAAAVGDDALLEVVGGHDGA